MSNLLEIKDQVFPGSTFHLSYRDQEIHLVRNWTGQFYKVAAQSARKVVMDEGEPSGLSRLLRKLLNDGTNPALELLELNSATQRYEPLRQTVKPADIEVAQSLFFRGAPAQAWLLMATGLARPSELGITVADARIAILAKNQDIS